MFEPPPFSHGDADWFVWLRVRTETQTWSEEQPGTSHLNPGTEQTDAGLHVFSVGVLSGREPEQL